MTFRSIASTAALLGVAILAASPAERLAAQDAQATPARQPGSEWENERILVRTVSVEPGARLAPAPGGADRVLVFLTADFEGRMPAEEAIWQAADGREQDNRGSLRVDAIAVDVKAGSGSGSSGTPVEAVWTADGATARVVIDNPRVAVMKLRYPPNASAVQPLHFHPQDALVVYLSGGHTSLPSGHWGFPARVRRGEFDVIPAHTLHRMRNVGGDGLEFLMIIPK